MGRVAFQTNWENLKAYAFPPFSLIPKVLKKVQAEEATITCNTSLANSSVVSMGISTVSKEPNINSKKEKPFIKSIQRGTPTGEEQNSSVSGLDSFREQLFAEGISGKTATLMTASRRKGTLSHYNSAWGKWGSWCDKRKIDPVRCSVNHMLDFLSDAFDQGLSHSTISGYRSAISAFHSPIEGLKVGNHPRVSALLTRVFNQRPPLPKFIFIMGCRKSCELH